MNIQKCLLISTAILLVTPIIGCARGPSLEEVMAKAYAATEELQSYRVESRLAQSKEVAMGLSSEATFEMEVVAPDRCHLTIHLGGDWGEDEFITIGEKQYSRHYRDSKWSQWGLSPHPTNGYGIYVSAPRQTLLLLHSLTDLKELQDAKVEGVDCLHYQGRVDMDKVVEEGKTKLDPSMSGYENIAENLEYQRQLKIEVEIWIGKEDYLIRQMKEDWQIPLEGEKWGTQSSLRKYYDFNEPIEIKPPQIEVGTGVDFTSHGGFSVSDEDPKHQQIRCRMTITNDGHGLARNVHLYVITRATNEEMEQPWMRMNMEAAPSTLPPVDLEPGESETYEITWEYDMTGASQEELHELIKETGILIRWSGEEGMSFSQSIPPGEKRGADREMVVMVQSNYKGNKLGLSSGFIVKPNGYIVTFLGNILEAEQIEVLLSDRRIFPATIVETDKITMLALLKIEGSGLVAATLGDASELEVGDRVWVTSCIPVSYLEMSAMVLDLDYSLPGLCPLTIRLNRGGWPGTAGGPVFNTEEAVIGVMIAANVDTGESFILPINQLETLLGAVR